MKAVLVFALIGALAVQAYAIPAFDMSSNMELEEMPQVNTGRSLLQYSPIPVPPFSPPPPPPPFNPEVSPVVESTPIPVALPGGAPCSTVAGEEQNIANGFCQNLIAAAGQEPDALICSAVVTCSGDGVLSITPTVTVPVDGDEPTPESEVLAEEVAALLDDPDAVNEILAETIPGSSEG